MHFSISDKNSCARARAFRNRCEREKMKFMHDIELHGIARETKLSSLHPFIQIKLYRSSTVFFLFSFALASKAKKSGPEKMQRKTMKNMVALQVAWVFARARARIWKFSCSSMFDGSAYKRNDDSYEILEWCSLAAPCVLRQILMTNRRAAQSLMAFVRHERNRSLIVRIDCHNRIFIDARRRTTE